MANTAARFAANLSRTGFIVGSGLLVADQAIYTVPAGHRSFIFDRRPFGEGKGVRPRVYGEGAQWCIPLLQYPIIMDTRVSPRTISTVTGTKDLQTVNLSLRVLFKPNPEKLPRIYSDIGLDYANQILPSVANEVLKATVAQYNADQLLTLRDKVSREIKDTLTQRCTKFHLTLEDVSITHLNFSADFSKAIEDKQVAEQMAERAKFMVAKAEQEKLALIMRSEGDAEAAKLVSSALESCGKGLIELRRIETAQEISEVLAKSRSVTYLPRSGNVLMNLGK
jgi:prohibitin 1